MSGVYHLTCLRCGAACNTSRHQNPERDRLHPPDPATWSERDPNPPSGKRTGPEPPPSDDRKSDRHRHRVTADPVYPSHGMTKAEWEEWCAQPS